MIRTLIRLVDDITWVKTTVNRRMAKGHGFYLQHAKETCLVGKKGRDPPGLQVSSPNESISMMLFLRKAYCPT
jgi:mRNA (2'-O-methyladenosine-N6-)-methyltransferase